MGMASGRKSSFQVGGVLCGGGRSLSGPEGCSAASNRRTWPWKGGRSGLHQPGLGHTTYMDGTQIHSGVFFSRQEECHLQRDHYVKQNKTDSERQILHTFSRGQDLSTLSLLS